MPRKLTKGYFVRGQFVAIGSELDTQLKRELKGSLEMSKTDLKKHSEQLQKLGQSLLSLRAELFNRLQLPEKLCDAIALAKRIDDFEGRRRQMQFIGKLMRGLTPEQAQAAQAAVDEQTTGSGQGALWLHQAEQWRERLLADDAALTQWLQMHAQSDAQQLRALIRQARKEAQICRDPAPGDAPDLPARASERFHGRAYRDIFKIVKAALVPSPDPALAPSSEATFDQESPQP